MELADGGSLNSYLKKNRGKVSGEQKLRMSVDAARGLAYLHSRNCVHRDVAARNCLVANGRVKISDFGLANQLVNQKDKIQMSQKEKLPVRWLAPEALKTSNYSMKADVYSFGVLMWEIYNDAETPYKDKTLEEVFKGVIESGLHLDRPKNMPEAVGRIMIEGCFERNPDKRWTMEKVSIRLLVTLLFRYATN